MPVNRSPSRLILVASCGAAALLGPQLARAQSRVAATAGNESQVTEVIVTAQKRTENVQNVPSAVSVVGAQELTDRHVTRLSDIGDYVPGLRIDSAGGTPGQTTISIRGITPIGTSATVGTYVDDIPLGGSSLYSSANSLSLDLLPYDVSRIEVLRGPQGTLYGASTMGGLLKYSLVTPSLDKLEERVGAEVLGVTGAGDPGGGVRASINAPVIKGKLGVLASYAFQDTPGYIDDAQTGQDNQNGVRQQSGRLGLLWKPQDNIRVNLGALYQQIDSDGNGTVALSPATRDPVFGGLKDANFLAQPFRKEISLLYGTVNWDFGWATLTSATSYDDTRTKTTLDTSRTYGVLLPLFVGGGNPAITAALPNGVSPFDIQLKLQKYTQEFRLASPAGQRIEWLIGGFFTYEKSTFQQTVGLQDPTGGVQAVLGVPFSTLGLSTLAVAQLPSIYREYAGFGDLTLHVTDRFDLAGGLRYASNNQSFRQISSGALLPPGSTPGYSSEDVVTYSFSPSYRIAPDILSYIRIASGYQPGGPNVALPGVPPTVGSDTLTNYEIGLKSKFWGRRATLNVDAFYIDWKDIQVGGTTAQGLAFLANGGTAKSQGFEAEGSVTPIQGLNLSGTFAYTYSVLTENVPALGGLDGARLPNVPRFSGSLQASYSHRVYADWVGRIGGGVRLQGSRYSDVSSSPRAFRLPAYGALDLNADVSNGRYTVRLFAKNLTDERVYTTFNPTLNGATGQIVQIEGAVLQPRTIGVSVDAKF